MMKHKFIEASLSFKEVLSYIVSGWDSFNNYDEKSSYGLITLIGGQVNFLSDVSYAIPDIVIEDEDDEISLSLEFAEWSEYDAQYILSDLGYLIMDRIISRFADSYVVTLPYDDRFDEEAKSASKRFIANLFNILNNTWEKYSTLYNILQEKKDALMNQVTATSHVKNRFNDTPQDSGEFEDDSHTTNLNITDGTTSSDEATPIARIDEIDRKMRNLILKWTNEFRLLFWENPR